MKFPSVSACEPLILTEGAVIERLRRDKKVALDPHVEHALLIYDREGRAELERIWSGYAAIARDFPLPMILLAPTWRASAERLQAAGRADYAQVNRDGVQFVAEVRKRSGASERILIGGLLGCRGDAYDPSRALSEKEAAAYHAFQVRALAASEADFLLAATLPAAGEAAGIARTMARSGLPYVLSFVIRATGTLLDGTPLSEAVRWIDTDTRPQPAGFMVNCVHPRVFAEGMEKECARRPELRQRVIGLQANASEKPPEELNGSAQLLQDSPEKLAEDMWQVHHRFGTRLLGGCCGTTERHIRAMAERIRIH